MTCYVVVRMVGAAPGGIGAEIEGVFLYEEAAKALAKKGEASGQVGAWHVVTSDLDHSDPDDMES